MSKNIKFGMASHRNISFHYVDDSGISEEEWAEMSEREQDEALRDYVDNNVQVWVEDE